MEVEYLCLILTFHCLRYLSLKLYYFFNLEIEFEISDCFYDHIKEVECYLVVHFKDLVKVIDSWFEFILNRI